ncbi:oxidoreductase [Pseudomonas sp. ADP]|nr:MULTISPECIES: SDR family oxidoreductase [unclassified Pseudomonas]KSW25806.1 oxidoreductase [Pseudomonas sp. ADP]OBP12323.1 oxidoreductase [Pseudomonas sp. EGD-AKN5]QOF82407.1 SDR family oxidoreductase [Pseudomonas sp. ADPe]
MKSVVITGVSSGIGRATAIHLAENGFHVFGSVRKAEDAESLSKRLGDTFTPLLFDVTDTAAVQVGAAIVRERLRDSTLAGLVNNAGIAVSGPFSHLPVDEYRKQLEINLVGPLIVTQAFLPLLGTERRRHGEPGRIINMSSLAGRIGIPFLGPYTVSKHGMEGFSESLRRELLFYGIDVITLGPGQIATPIWDKGEEMDITPYAGLEIAPAMQRSRDHFIAEGKRGLPAERMAEIIFEVLTERSPKARYAIIPDRLRNWTLPLLLPTRLVDRLIARQYGIRRS